MTTAMRVAGAAHVVATMPGACSPSPSPWQNLARELAGKIGVDGMSAQLGRLQEIADANKAHPRQRHGQDTTPAWDYVA